MHWLWKNNVSAVSYEKVINISFHISQIWIVHQRLGNGKCFSYFLKFWWKWNQGDIYLFKTCLQFIINIAYMFIFLSRNRTCLTQSFVINEWFFFYNIVDAFSIFCVAIRSQLYTKERLSTFLKANVDIEFCFSKPWQRIK